MKTAKVLITLLVISFIVFNFIPVNVKAGPYDDWPYYIRVFVTENSGNDLVNYPFKIRIEWKPAMKPDFSDIRVSYINSTTLEETPTCYWIESYNEYDYADIWVLIPYLPANGTVELKIYYGNELAKSQSNKECVFYVFEEDFSTDRTYAVEETVSFNVNTYVDLENKRYVIESAESGSWDAGSYVYASENITIPDYWDNCDLQFTIKYNYTYHVYNNLGKPKNRHIRFYIADNLAYDKEYDSSSSSINVETLDEFSITVNDVPSGNCSYKFGIYVATTEYQAEEWLYTYYIQIVVKPYANPAPSYGITYPQSPTYTPKPGKWTPKVIYPKQQVNPIYFPPPPNVVMSDPVLTTTGGIITFGMLVAIAIGLARAEGNPLALAVAAALMMAIGLLLNNTGITSVSSVVFIVTIAYYFTRKRRM